MCRGNVFLWILLGTLSLGAGHAYAESKACRGVQQNLSDVLELTPKTSAQATQKNLATAINLSGLWAHCKPPVARKFVKTSILPARYWNDEFLKCELLEAEVKAEVTDSKASSSVEVGEAMSDALLKLAIHDKYCGKASKKVYELSLCHVGGHCK